MCIYASVFGSFLDRRSYFGHSVHFSSGASRQISTSLHILTSSRIPIRATGGRLALRHAPAHEAGGLLGHGEGRLALPAELHHPGRRGHAVWRESGTRAGGVGGVGGGGWCGTGTFPAGDQSFEQGMSVVG